MIDDRVVLVTGAGSGIGAAIAAELAARGWRVAVNDVNPTLAESSAAAIGGHPVPGDVVEDSGRLVAHTVEEFGTLTALVNNAGILRPASLTDLADDSIDPVIDVNLKGTLRMCQAALPWLVRSAGSIVNLASLAGVTPLPLGGVYSASKAAIIALTSQSAIEWGAQGVRVNAVAPGMIRTQLGDRDGAYSDPDTLRRRAATVPLGRIGSPDDVARVVAFLVSPDAGYVSGQTLVVDGGWMHTLVAQMAGTAWQQAAEASERVRR